MLRATALRNCRIPLLATSCYGRFAHTSSKSALTRAVSRAGWTRTLSTSRRRPDIAHNVGNASSVPQANPDAVYAGPVLYEGPLSTTFRRLKMFSLSSLSLSFAMAPIILTVTSTLPTQARIALAGTAVLTSGISTAMVAWAGRPYVVALRRLGGAPHTEGHTPNDHTPSHNELTPSGVEFETLTITMRTLRTRVYDPVFLADTRRPFAKWELAVIVQLPEAEAREVQPGMEETVAETFDKDGKVMGSWIVKWGENGEGICRGQGWIVRYAGFYLLLS